MKEHKMLLTLYYRYIQPRIKDTNKVKLPLNKILILGIIYKIKI